MIVLGAIFLGEKLEERFERDLFIIIMVEMLLLGLILKATYYLYMHPWEDMNPRHKTNVLWHKVTVYTLGQKLLAMLNRRCQINMQGPQLFAKPRQFFKLDVATSRMAFLDINLHILQLESSNSHD